MKRIAVLPTLVTLGNGVCGFAAIAHLIMAHITIGLVGEEAIANHFADQMERACWFILGAMVFDALDGSVARLAKVSSEFGAQLDSLADMISFGLAPAMTVMVVAMNQHFLPRVGWVAGSLFLVCAMLRLARYNVESTEHEGPTLYFAGLPAPAAGGFVASLVLIHFHVKMDQELGSLAIYLQSLTDILVKFLPLVACLTALLMVSRVPYVHLINRLLRDQEPFDYVVRIVLVVLFFFFTRPFSLPLAFGLYVLWGLLTGLRRSVSHAGAAT